MADYTEKTKEELVEEARQRELSGYSTKNKDELVSLLEENDASQGTATQDGSTPDNELPASDLDNPDVRANLSPSGQEAADRFEETGQEALKDEADAALDASGPLHLQSPDERVMTGAVSEQNAEEQRKIIKDNSPKDHVGPHSESGQPLGAGLAPDDQNVAKAKGDKKDNLSDGDDRELYEVRPEHVIDFPPPVGQREGTTERGQDRASDRQDERNPELAYGEPNGALGNPVIGAGSRSGDVYSQKSVLYTDGLSGAADHNLERAYEIPEVLQSNAPAERAAGDESLSEAAKAEKTDRENRLASFVKERDDDPASREALKKQS